MDSEELVDLIYAALLGERTWEDFLKALSEQLPDGVATLFYHDSEKSRGSWDLVYGADASALRDGGYYASINPWMKRAATRQVGVGVISDQMLPVNELKRTEFYTDFVYGRFRTRAAVGLTIVREEGKSFLLSVLTSREDPDENARAAELLTQLAPHLRRAFHYFRAGPKHRPNGCWLKAGVHGSTRWGDCGYAMRKPRRCFSGCSTAPKRMRRARSRVSSTGPRRPWSGS